MTNWPKLRNNARLATGSQRHAYIDKATGISECYYVSCFSGPSHTRDGYFIIGKLYKEDITHLNKKLTPAGIAHKAAGWPYGVPGKGFEQ